MPSDTPATPLLLTASDAAKALAVCPKTLYSLTAPRGPIPAVRIGRAVRYSADDLRRWIDRARTGGAE